MKAQVMKEVAVGLVDVIRRHVHETREALESRIRASDSVVADLRADVEALSQKLDFAESAIAELQRTLALKRVA